LSLYTTTHADEILARVEATAPDFISRSLRILGYERWDQVAHRLQCIAAIKDHANPKQAEEIRELVLLDNKDGDLIQLTILLSIVWPTLVSLIEGSAALAQKLGFTPEDFGKLDLPSKSREFARAKKDGRLAPVIAQSS
jgi:hypothetical protein